MLEAVVFAFIGKALFLTLVIIVLAIIGLVTVLRKAL